MLKVKLWVYVVAVLASLITIIFCGFEIKYWNRIYPGAKVLGNNLGGMSKDEALAYLFKITKNNNQVKLVWGTNSWTIEFKDLKAYYRIEETVKSAMKIGRKGKLFSDFSEKLTAMRAGENIDLEFILDENSLMGAIATSSADINVPAQEPEISYDPLTGKVEVTTGENGQEVDSRKLALDIKNSITNVTRQDIKVPVVALEPKLNSQQLETAKNRAQMLVGKKLKVNFLEGEQNWEVDSVQLMTWLDPSAGSGQGGWKLEQISGWAAQLAGTLDRPAQNASFQFVSSGRVQEFKPAKEGWKVDQTKLITNVLAGLDAISNNESIFNIDLAVSKIDPTIKNSDVNNLGIKELLGRGESWFSGSIDNRIFNLEKATGVLNGVLVAPGETFSFNQALGEVSAKTGYKQAYVINKGKTELGDGGGVCQTSTTMFRAVLAAGLPITERAAHAYRVSYYEEKYQPGFDATVFQPSPDFKFVNDTPGYILIQTSVDPVAKKLVYEIYGTSDGRKAEISKARTWDVAAPPPDLYQDDPTLPVGVVRQTEHAAWGAKIAFDWKVTRGEEVLQQRTFYSSYAPWQAVYLKGTKI